MSDTNNNAIEIVEKNTIMADAAKEKIEKLFSEFEKFRTFFLRDAENMIEKGAKEAYGVTNDALKISEERINAALKDFTSRANEYMASLLRANYAIGNAEQVIKPVRVPKIPPQQNNENENQIRDYPSSVKGVIKRSLTYGYALRKLDPAIRKDRKKLEFEAKRPSKLNIDIYFAVTGGPKYKFVATEEEATKWLAQNMRYVHELRKMYSDAIVKEGRQYCDGLIRELIFAREGDEMIHEALDEIFDTRR